MWRIYRNGSWSLKISWISSTSTSCSRLRNGLGRETLQLSTWELTWRIRRRWPSRLLESRLLFRRKMGRRHLLTRSRSPRCSIIRIWWRLKVFTSLRILYILPCSMWKETPSAGDSTISPSTLSTRGSSSWRAFYVDLRKWHVKTSFTATSSQTTSS